MLYYTPSIFKMAGAGVESALLQSVIVGFTMLVFTMLAMIIIDHFGRRKLMIVGSIGYIVGLAGAAYAFYARAQGSLLLVSLLVFIAAHGFGQGAVIWVFISEIFPNRVRARGQALGSFTHWAMNAVISWTFPMIAAAAGWMAFGFYALCMVGQLCLGADGHAGDEGRLAGEDSGEARHRVAGRSGSGQGLRRAKQAAGEAGEVDQALDQRQQAADRAAVQQQAAHHQGRVRDGRAAARADVDFAGAARDVQPPHALHLVRVPDLDPRGCSPMRPTGSPPSM